MGSLNLRYNLRHQAELRQTINCPRSRYENSWNSVGGVLTSYLLDEEEEVNYYKSTFK